MTTWFIWGVFPYVCAALFFIVPIIRMVYRPFSWTTRASGLFGKNVLGAASLFLHWGLFLLVIGHLAGLIGGLAGSENWITFFFWTGLIGGVSCLLGSVMAFVRRLTTPEVRAMSQPDDYIVHLFLMGIISLALYQVVVHRIFGIAYTASSWFASLWQLSPQPELMASASLITKLHVLLALTFFAYFPFTKLAHFWTYPVNFFVRPNLSMRTDRYRFQRRWEFAGRSDKSWLVYAIAALIVGFGIAATQLGRASLNGNAASVGASPASSPASGEPTNPLMGAALYVSQCARCHGISGRGDGAGAMSPTFSTQPRDLTAAHYHFATTANGVASDTDLYRIITQGLAGSGMPGFAQLTDAQRRSLVAVLNGFRSQAIPAGPSIAVGTVPPATPASIARGKELFTACSACHGADGRGTPGFALPDWRGLPIVPANLAAGRLKDGASPKALYRRISAGVPGAANDGYLMPPFQTLSSDDRWALVHYLRAEVLPADITRR